MPEGEMTKPRNSVVSTENLHFSVGKDKDVVQVYYDVLVEDVREDAIHEALEGGGSIGEAEMHDEEIEGAVASAEGGLPLVAWGDANEVVGSSEIDLGENLRVAEAIEEVWDERERVAILLGDLVEAAPIDTEAERAVFLLDE